MIRRIRDLALDLNPVLSSCVLFIFLMSWNVLTFRNAEFLNKKLIFSQSQNTIQHLTDQIISLVHERKSDIEILAQLWPNYPEENQEANFLRDATRIANQKPVYHTINLLDTNSTVRISAPLQKRPDLNNFDLSIYPERKELHRKVAAEKRPLCSPPLRFNNGQLGMVIWYPVVTEKSGEKINTGLIAGTFYIQELIQVMLSSVNRNDFQTRISINGTTYHSDFSTSTTSQSYNSSIKVLGVDWNIGVQVAPKSHFRNLINGSLWLFVTGTAIAVIATLLFALVLMAIKRIRKNQIDLRKSEENYRQLFQVNPHPMIVFDLQSLEILSVNNAAIYAYGYTEEEFLSMTVRDLSPLDSYPFTEQFLEEIRSGQHKSDIAHHRKKNGEIFRVEIISHSLEIKNGRPTQIALINDVTEKLIAEEALKRNEENLSITLNSIGDAVIVTDHAGSVVRMNPAAEKMTGWSLYQGLGKNLGELCCLSKKDTEENLLPYIISVKDFYSSVIPLVLKGRDSTELLVSCSSAQLISKDRKLQGMVLVLQDITERVQLEEQLRQSQKLEVIGQLAGGVAHDFNNILLPIVAYADLALHKAETGQEITDDLTEIIKAADRAKNLVNQLLAFSRKQLLQTKVVNINSILENISGMLQRLIGENITIEMQLSPDIGNIKADVSQIEQILLNMAVNARDAMPDGGKLTFITSETILNLQPASLSPDLPEGNYILLKVTDTGIGMDEKTREKIFEPFFTTKDKFKGTGLGLATAYGIVKQHGGTIQVKTEPDKGTSFLIFIPKCSEFEETALPEQKPAACQPEINGISILLVEDEQIVRTPISRFLTGKGVTVTEAQNGRLALDLIIKNERKFDIVITDVVMPEMNGKELCDEIAKTAPGIRVIYMSGYSDDIITNKGILDNDVNFLRKPFSMETLWEIVQKTLRDPEKSGSLPTAH